MIAELISIGDELLIGQTINTNATWIGKELSEHGITIQKVTTIKDQAYDIQNSIDQALKHADLIIVTGGLGPTKDDITKKVIAEYFQQELIIHEATLAHVRSIFERSKRPMLDINIQQAAVPKDCIVLHNKNGTAPGMWLEKQDKIVICLPGVPFEMKGLMQDKVLPRLEQKNLLKNYYSQTANIQGIGESYLANEMESWEDDIRNNGLELAYLPSPGVIRLRISSKNGLNDAPRISNYFKQLETKYPNNFIGYGESTLPEVIGQLLMATNQTVGAAESCTGGAIAASIVSVAGASSYFQGGFVTYSNEMKSTLLGVNPQLIEMVGAVSEEVVKEMANGGKERLKTDYCIAVSGIAGPDGGTEEKPVGTVWIAIAGPKQTVAKAFHISDNRERFIQRTVLTALNFLKNEINR